MRPSPYLLICLLLPLSLHNLCLLNYLLCFRLAPIFLFFVFFPLYTVLFFPHPSFIICLFHLLHLCRIYTFSPSSLLQSSFFPPSFKICLLSLLFYFRLFLFFPLSLPASVPSPFSFLQYLSPSFPPHYTFILFSLSAFHHLFTLSTSHRSLSLYFHISLAFRVFLQFPRTWLAPPLARPDKNPIPRITR